MLGTIALSDVRKLGDKFSILEQRIGAVFDVGSNMLKNGDFSKGIDGDYVAENWIKSAKVMTKEFLQYNKGERTQKVDTLYNNQAMSQPMDISIGDKLYYEVVIAGKVRTEEPVALRLGIGYDPDGNMQASTGAISSVGLTRGVYTSPLSGSFIGLTGHAGVRANAILSRVFIVNLTTVFGAGLEPTLEEIESLGIDGIITLRSLHKRVADLETRETDIEDTVDLIRQHLPTAEPSIPRLTWSTITTGSSRPKWLSSDGEVLFGNNGSQLLQSKDEWETTEPIGDLLPRPIAGVRELSTGELLVSTTGQETAGGTRAKLYKTVGYSRENPSETTFKQVLESLTDITQFTNHWGFSVYENIVVVSEYGQWDETGARRVYLSTDYGDTFSQIFDLLTTEAIGRPPIQPNAHVHSCCYDPYHNRIWITVGDRPNSGVYYSDNLGESWVFVENSDVTQFTTVTALPSCVLFGTDDTKSAGIYVYRRKHRSKMPTIEPLFLLNERPTITHVFQGAFRRNWDPTTPVYLSASGSASAGEKSVLFGVVDDIKAHLLWEADSEGDFSYGIMPLGPTKSGNLISFMTDPGITGYRVVKAEAPEWIKP
jgi:hypothetical protein